MHRDEGKNNYENCQKWLKRMQISANLRKNYVHVHIDIRARISAACIRFNLFDSDALVHTS